MTRPAKSRTNQARDWDVIDAEEKQNRKMRKLTKNAMYCIGGGIGLLLVQHFFGQTEGSSITASDINAQDLLRGLGLITLSYGVIMVASLALIRSQARKVNFFMLFFVVPTLIIKVVVDTLM